MKDRMQKRYNITSILLIWALCFTAQAAIDPQEMLEKQWLEVRSPNFHIITDAKEKVALKMARDLENFRFFASSLLRVDLVEGLAPVKILAIHHKSNFHDLGLPEDWGGVFKQTIDGPYAIASIRHYELDSGETNYGKRTLLHEYVHYVSENTFSKLIYPLWYSEGIAEYLSTFKYENNEITFGSAEALMDRALYLDYSEGKFRSIGIEDLFKARRIDTRSEKRSDSRAVYRFYAKATAVVHYLNSTNENAATARNYIALINEGYDIDTALRKSFSRSFQDLEQEVLAYLNESRLTKRKFTATDGLSFPEIAIKTNSLSAADTAFHISEFLTQFLHYTKVGFDPVMSLMKKSLANDPHNVEKKILHARLLFAGGRHEECRSRLEEILEKHPGHADALALYGDILLEEAISHRQVGFAGWEQTLESARSQYRKAIKRNPANGRAYYGLAKSYTLKTGDEPLEEAFVALDSARFFSPDRELLWHEALLRLRTHDNLNAIPLLRRYVNIDDGDNFDLARSLLDLQELRLLAKMEAENPAPGRYVYADGSTYEGSWKQGMPEGRGALLRPNGVKYTGSWKGGLIHGDGEFISSNGRKYVMPFKNGEATGAGELFHPNGSYKGELLNGLAHGKGEMSYLKDGKPAGRYTGQFWLTLKHGPGLFYAEDKASRPSEWIFGKSRIDFSKELVFVGDEDSRGRPQGFGRCVNKKSNKVTWCRLDSTVDEINKRQHVKAAHDGSFVKIISVKPKLNTVFSTGDKVKLEVEAKYSFSGETGILSLIVQDAGNSYITHKDNVIRKGGGKVVLEAELAVPDTEMIHFFVSLKAQGQTTTSTFDSRAFKVIPE
jgi:hypothetical protein